MFCRVKKSIKEYREWQLKMYTRMEDVFEQRLAGVSAAKRKLQEQIERDQVREDITDNPIETVTSPIDEQG